MRRPGAAEIGGSFHRQKTRRHEKMRPHHGHANGEDPHAHALIAALIENVLDGTKRAETPQPRGQSQKQAAEGADERRGARLPHEFKKRVEHLSSPTSRPRDSQGA
ncbi:MAG: hypothetical protein D6811_02175 [Alphaproteobacteria bacterium]|nr:MAG: hypothetical protein D6811_02175 [Alphaproteobacteria bacterium]